MGEITFARDISRTRDALHTATRQVEQAQDRVRIQEKEAICLSRLVADLGNLLSQETALIRRCDRLHQEVEQTEQKVAQNKNDAIKAWQETSLCVNRARTANLALSKTDYATAILKIIGVCADDSTVHAALTDIVAELADHDDRNGSVHGIETEEHPNGLLIDMQKKLEHSLMAPSRKPVVARRQQHT